MKQDFDILPKVRGGYFKVFTLRLPAFSAKLWPHGYMAEKKLCSTYTPPQPQLQPLPKAIYFENEYWFIRLYYGVILGVIRGYIRGYQRLLEV